MLVGDGKAGKTSLRRFIDARNPRLQATKPISLPFYLELERIELDSNADNSDPLTITVYDCGGQQDYAVGQEPFLTGSSPFLVSSSG